MRLFLFLLIALIIKIPVEAKEYKYEISVMAMFQNEGPYLKEWIDYHLLIGVDHFYLYNHNSTDHFQEVLAPYIEQGIVDFFDYSGPDFPQRKACDNALLLGKEETKWMAFIDIDEFILPKKHDSLKEFLANYETAGGISINWQCFGTSNVPSILPGELMIEHLIFKSLPEFMYNRYVKCIVRPERIKKAVNLHSFICYTPYCIVRPNKFKQPLEATSSVQTGLIVINHYWTKDETFFDQIKIPRCQRRGWSKEMIERLNQSMNAIEDLTIVNKYVERLKQFQKRNNPQKSS